MPTTPAPPEVTRILAEFVAGHPAGVAGRGLQSEVKRALLDLLGVTVRGSVEPAGRVALRYANSYGSTGAAAVVGGRTRIAAPLAALVNGTAGHALDFDDIGLGAGHVSVAIVPAALAAAESAGATGSEFLDALVLGYEVAHRLTRMYSDTRLGPYAAGYHKPSVYSVFGATAAAARILRLSADQLQNALGIAASQAGGLRINFGTMTKPLHAGLSNRTALEAVSLARDGFTASPDALEGRFGWHDVLCRGEGDLGVVVEGLGEHFALSEGLIYKLYPCCGANHYAIDAVVALMRAHELTADDVAEIDVYIERRNLEEVLVYPWPRTPLEGKFSLAYNVASAVADGSVTIETFSEEALGRLATYRDRIRVHPVDDLPQNGASIRIRTADGRMFARKQLVLRGSLEDPVSWDELCAKFMANANGLVHPDALDAVVEAIGSLQHQESLVAVTEPLLGGA